jgi:NitT/TauT family transport system ATP-binding protein
MSKNTTKYYLPISGIIIFLIFWQLVSSFLLPGTSLLPTPISVDKAVFNMFKTESLYTDLCASLSRILIGFFLALVAATMFGIIAFRFSKIYAFVKLIMDLLSSIPPIAWTPIAILWFGIGNAPAYFIVFLGAFFPMFSNFYAAIKGVDKGLINAAKTLGASADDISIGVIFPAALPQIFQGVKIGLNVAWFNVIAAELIGVNSGLGYKIQLNRELLASDNVIGLMILIGVIGLLMIAFVNFLSKLIAPWALQTDTREYWLKYHIALKRILKKSANRYDKVVKASSLEKLISNYELLELNHLSKCFVGRDEHEPLMVLKDVSFKIKPGQVTSVIGPNGCGKSTIVNIIAGLLPADGGKVIFENQQVRFPSSERTVVFQDLALFPWQTCREHIAYSINYNRNKGQTYSELAYLKLAGLEEFADSYPFQLSGGMKQRLAIMRAVAAEPKIILMDEPFASFDPLVRNTSQETILKLLKSQKETTVLIVTHDIDEAIFMSDEVVVLSNRPTVVKEIIKVNLARPRADAIRLTQEFISIRNNIWKILNNNSESLPKSN